MQVASIGNQSVLDIKVDFTNLDPQVIMRAPAALHRAAPPQRPQGSVALPPCTAARPPRAVRDSLT